MDIVSGSAGREGRIVDLFTATFTASEGAEEGATIGALVHRLLSGTAPADIRVFTALDGDRPVGGVIFTRLRFADDPRPAVLLSPMAVIPDRQGEGIGQALIRHGLAALRAEGVELAMTYGDPAFYGRVGFQPVTPATVPPPFPLSQPVGWIGQSLTDADLPILPGPSRPVDALNDPTLW